MKVSIKNCTCYYFAYIIKLEDFNPDNILIDQKAHENILIHGISYKSIIVSYFFRIRLDKINGIIIIYDKTRYLTLFSSEKFNVNYGKVRYVISIKSGTAHIFPHYSAKIKVDSYDSLSIRKTLCLHVIIFIQSVINKDRNKYYYKIFLETCS